MIHPGISRPSYIRVVAGVPGSGVSWTTSPSGKRSVRRFRIRSQAGSICTRAGLWQVSNSLPSSPMTRNSRSPVIPYGPSWISLARCSRMPLTGAMASWDTVTGTVIPPAANGTTFSQPAIAQVGNTVVIAVEGVYNSLDLYWQTNGASGWNAETVATIRTTYSTPSLAQNGNTTIIAAEGP